MTEEEMAKRYINLIYVVLKDLGLNTADGINDYYDVGMMGLLKGIRIYDYTKNYSPTTILFRTIRAEILSQIEKERALKRGKGIKPLSLETPQLNRYNDEYIHLEELIGTKKNILDKLIEIEERTEIKRKRKEKEAIQKKVLKKVYNEIDKFKPLHKEIIYSFYGVRGRDVKTILQLEKEYNLSHGYPRKIMKIKFKEIREKIEIL